ncbi:MAG: peptidoglycan D,D-transpeptidase FtsI family protein [Chromatiales bacterium]
MAPIIASYTGRRTVMMGIFTVAAAALIARAVALQFTHREFLQSHGDARFLRVVSTAAHRGMITDRMGEPLAISTPVSSVWANPRKVSLAPADWKRLAKLLDTDVATLKDLVATRKDKDFVYLKRQVDPELARRVTAAGLPGIAIDREYRRYYPTGEVTAHLLGFTNVDDHGQEGIELAFDNALRGTPGAKRVIKDRLGRVVESVESIRAANPGRNLTLTIDKRLQYLAYRELKSTVFKHRAQAGAVVILDARTGEVLAMVNQPSYNPNNRGGLRGEYYRNRAVTDVFEPGSTLKPFTIAAALESGEFQPNTPIQTGPGFFAVGEYKVRDIRNYGTLDVTGVISKSSNVGAARIALAMEPQQIWRMLSLVGFGNVTAIRFPGEAPGRLTDYRHWREIEQATLAFGYGLSVTVLQLAQAYTALANDGVLVPMALLRTERPTGGRRIMSAATAAQVRAMLETVIRDGTGRLAYIPGYRVAGKTGTVHKTNSQGYAEDRYLSLFAGMVPASNPRLVAVVVIDDPRDGEYFGGRVAAPVFSRVMQEALRLFGAPPDDPLGHGEQMFAYVPPTSMESFDDMGRHPEPGP